MGAPLVYTKAQFGKELKQELTKDFDVVHLSRWAYRKYLEKTSQLENGVDEVMMKIVAMEEGPEFEYTKEELIELANDLQK